MKTKFNFKSSVCTSREQSERLLALGLKKETADCVWIEISKDDWRLDANSWKEYYSIIEEGILPAWSLGRLVEDLMPQTVTYRLNDYHLSLNLGEGMIGYFPPRLSARIRALEYFYGNDTILDDCVSCIEWLIKEGYFNKEYLVLRNKRDKKIKNMETKSLTTKNMSKEFWICSTCGKKFYEKDSIKVKRGYKVETHCPNCGSVFVVGVATWTDDIDPEITTEIEPLTETKSELKFKTGNRVFNKVTRKWVNIIEFDTETGLYIVRYDDGIQGRSLESELCETDQVSGN